jgi:hypothetical protein
MSPAGITPLPSTGLPSASTMRPFQPALGLIVRRSMRQTLSPRPAWVILS